MFSKKISLSLLPLIATVSLHASDPFFNDPFGDDIFKEMMQMQHNMDQMFERMHQRMQKRTSGLVTPLGTYKMAVDNQFIDKGDHYELLTNIPQSKENHIDIKTANGLMSITAKIVQTEENRSTNGISQSHSVRIYQQSMTLPKDVDESTIKTEYKNGRLVVSIDKNVSKKVGGKALKPKKDLPKLMKNSSKNVETNTSIKKMMLHTDLHEMS